MVDVTVVVPTHNRRQLVAQAVHSILHQEGVSLELVVVDDGSTDGTGPWLDRIAATDSRIKIVHHERPRFISSARNAGIARASGRWVAFCDDDDLWAPDKLSSQLAALRASSARWGCTGVVGGRRASRDHRTSQCQRRRSPCPSAGGQHDPDGFVSDRGAQPGARDWRLRSRASRLRGLGRVDQAGSAFAAGGSRSPSDSLSSGRAEPVHGRQPHADMAARSSSTDMPRSRPSMAPSRTRRRTSAISPSSSCVVDRDCRPLPYSRASRSSTAAGVSFRVWPPHCVAPRLTDRLGRSRATAQVPVAWRREAEAWIQPIRAACRTELRRSYVGAEVEALGA